MEQKKMGSVTTTYKLHLYRKHLNWLRLTQELYHSVFAFYYEVLLNHQELLERSNYSLMRELEILTVGTKEMKKAEQKPEYSLETFPKLPLYFRRAVINGAISLVRSYQKNLENWEQNPEVFSCPSTARQFHAAPVYYKGMYKDFTESSICLKLYTGEIWKWVKYRYTGRELPKNAEWLSPSIKIGKKEAWLHVPVVETVGDIRTIAERMETEEKILAVSFPGNDVMAVCCVLDKDGKKRKSCFLRGGKELKAKRKQLVRKMEKVRKSRGKKERSEGEVVPERVYLEKIERLNEMYAHRISRKIVSFAQEEDIKVIVVPHYEEEIAFQKMRYFKVSEYDWIGRKIIRFLKYKAFQKGIVVGSVGAYHIADRCSECGSEIKKYNEGHRANKRYYGGKLYVCEKGHRGNSGENTARNIGKRFLERYQGIDEL